MSWRLNDDDDDDNDVGSDDMLMMMMMTTIIMIIWAKTGFILECGLAGFPQFGKTMPQVAVSKKNNSQKNDIIKNRPKDKYYFFLNKVQYSKTSMTTTLIWRPLDKLTLNFYSLLLSQLPFSSSFESLFHQTNIRDSAVLIRSQVFSVAQNVPKWRQSVRRVRPMLNRQKSKKALIFFGFGALFLGPSFLKKDTLKLQKGAHLTLIGQFLE